MNTSSHQPELRKDENSWEQKLHLLPVRNQHQEQSQNSDLTVADRGQAHGNDKHYCLFCFPLHAEGELPLVVLIQ